MMLRNSTISRLLTLIFCIIFAQSGHGRIIYVDPDASSPHDGSNWSNAYSCLQNALEVASDGDEIRVAEGTYKPDQRSVDLGGRLRSQIVASGDREATFQLINGVTINGGYAGFGQSDPNARDIEAYKTILSGDLAGNDAETINPYTVIADQRKSDNSYHVVRSSDKDTTAIFDGFTITSGSAC